LIPIVAERYQDGAPSPRNVWRFSHKVKSTQVGAPIRIEALASAKLHWSDDNWETAQDDDMVDSGVGAKYFDIPLAVIQQEKTIVFTFFWTDSQSWEGIDFAIQIGMS